MNKRLNVHVLVMAGGTGERFWPVSRRAFPKQFHAFTGARSCFQHTIDRARTLAESSHIYVITQRQWIPLVKKQCPCISASHILAEPCARNTLPALVWGVYSVQKRMPDPDTIILMLPSDHEISPDDEFQKTLSRAVETAMQHDSLVLVGIHPRYPATGYGYIGLQKDINKDFAYPCYRVREFVEKPTLLHAKKLIQKKNYWWNAGIFCAKSRVILHELNQHMPDMARLFAADQNKISTIYKKVEPISIDYGILQKTSHCMMVPASFSWEDLGSWESLMRGMRTDASGNVTIGKWHGVRTKNSFIFSDTGHLVSTVGLKDVIVVQTKDATLVCHRDYAQDVRHLVAELKKKGYERYL